MQSGSRPYCFRHVVGFLLVSVARSAYDELGLDERISLSLPPVTGTALNEVSPAGREEGSLQKQWHACRRALLAFRIKNGLGVMGRGCPASLLYARLFG
jgi:hypothetical protein